MAGLINRYSATSPATAAELVKTWSHSHKHPPPGRDLALRQSPNTIGPTGRRVVRPFPTEENVLGIGDGYCASRETQLTPPTCAARRRIRVDVAMPSVWVNNTVDSYLHTTGVACSVE